ncbi:hypothetical protein ACF08M_24115 [Streptomyces sp. NPDC015032]|uniref:hypothetical protein n=1 Tax=Streptomyces sp. NPDC015032 TaxID=3364937 RepID=UPI0036F5BEAA
MRRKMSYVWRHLKQLLLWPVKAAAADGDRAVRAMRTRFDGIRARLEPGTGFRTGRPAG